MVSRGDQWYALAVKILQVLSLGCLAFAVSTTATAQLRNYNGTPIGERAAGMGGAYTAVADDSSAIWYNPAGLGRIKKQGLSGSVSAYAYRSLSIDSIYAAEGEEVSLKQDGLVVYPGSTAYVLPLGSDDAFSHTLAAGVFVLHHETFDGVLDLSFKELFVDIDFADTSSETTYGFGLAYGAAFGRFSLGLTVLGRYVDAATFQSIAYTDVVDNEVIRSMQVVKASGNYLGLGANLGVMWEPLDELRFALALRTPTFRILGSAKYFTAINSSVVEQDTGAATLLYQDVFRNQEGEVNYKNPTALILGASWGRKERVQIAADVQMFFPLDAHPRIEGAPTEPDEAPGEILPGETPRTFDTTIRSPGSVTVVNAALGSTVTIVPGWAAMGGVFTDLSSVPTGEEGDTPLINRYGASLALHKYDEDSTLSVGVVGQYGSGQAGGTNLDTNMITLSDATEWSLTIFLAGSSVMGGDEEPTEQPPAETNAEAVDVDEKVSQNKPDQRDADAGDGESGEGNTIDSDILIP